LVQNITSHTYKAAVYLRLSKEDDDLINKSTKNESNSISNQKALILNILASTPDTTLYDLYIDDGYTGLNFNRPAFQRMKRDLFDGNANMVIVKDLSRFSRDYIEAGQYIKTIFPSLNIRFVSILDHYDSLASTQSELNLLIPVKNFVNDNYSRDISCKIRSNQDIMRKNGLYIGSYVSYGYKKMITDKNKIVPDEYAAAVVKKIFAWKLNGMNSNTIANKLNRLGIVPPSEYKRTLGINYKTGFQTNLLPQWSAVSVTRILKNKIYIGTLEQGKRKKINYKLDLIKEKTEAEWFVIPDHHEAIISKNDFENVSRLFHMDIRKGSQNKLVSLFSGLLFCGDCGQTMVRRTNSSINISYITYICSTYNKSLGCTNHRIKETFLYEIILNIIRINISLSNLIDSLTINNIVKQENSDININDKEILARYNDLDHCIQMKQGLYNDLQKNIISENEYLIFEKIYLCKIEKLKQEVHFLRDEVNYLFNKNNSNKEWLKQIAAEGNITKLDRNNLFSLVKKIILYEKKRIEIIFKYQDVYQSAQQK
jgi:DNA invertase Pin-like site-specific DNA recombinase